VLFEVDGQDTMAVFSKHQAFRPGERLALAPKPGMVHVFDSASGRRI